MFYSKKKITVELVGGIGNQLFGYFAGVWIASNLRLELKLDFENSVVSHTKARASIQSLDLAFPYTATVTKSKSMRKFSRQILEKINHESDFLGSLLNTLLGNYLDDMQNGGMNKILLEILEKKKPRRVRGYFNSFEYFYKIPVQYQRINLKSKSPEFIALMDDLKRTNPIIMHIRRGDYVANKKTYGLLSKDYYLNAIEMIKTKKPDSPIWVFSDDSETAKRIIREIPDTEFRLVTIDELENPLETLILMSSGSAHILANSTFSQWAAVLGNSPLVICPKEYFADGRVNIEYPKENWIAIESMWE